MDAGKILNLFIYDDNGNMVFDLSKNMAIQYDWSNLPVKFIIFSSIPSGTTFATWSDVATFCANYTGAGTEICMTYDASGNRVKKEVFNLDGAGTGISQSAPPPASSEPSLLVTNTAQTTTMAFNTDGTIYTNQTISALSGSVPTGALVIQNASGTQLALSSTGLAIAGTMTDNGSGTIVSGDLTAT